MFFKRKLLCSKRKKKVSPYYRRRPLLNNRHLAEPPWFLLYTTFLSHRTIFSCSCLIYRNTYIHWFKCKIKFFFFLCQNSLGCAGSPAHLIQQFGRVWSVEECHQRCLAEKACNYFTSYALVESSGLAAGLCTLLTDCASFNYKCRNCHFGKYIKLFHFDLIWFKTLWNRER